MPNIKKEKKSLHKFFFPKENITIEAETIEKATLKLKK
jgi:hypothetical protein